MLFGATTLIVLDDYLFFMVNKEGALYTCAYHKNTGATSLSRADETSFPRDLENYIEQGNTVLCLYKMGK